mgnify:FL=1
MKEYKLNSPDENYDILDSGDKVIVSPQLIPSGESLFFDTTQSSGYPSYPSPDPSGTYGELIVTQEVEISGVEQPPVFNFNELTSTFSNAELLEDPITFTNPYIHYVPRVYKNSRGTRKKQAVYINYLADYKVTTIVPNPYAAVIQSILDKINNQE